MKNLKNFIKNIHWLISTSSKRYPNFTILLKILKRFYKSSDSKCKIKNRLLKIPKRLRISNSKYRKSKNSMIYFNSKTNCQNFLKKSPSWTSHLNVTIDGVSWKHVAIRASSNKTAWPRRYFDTIEHRAKLRQNSISLDVRTRLGQVATGSNVDLSCVNVEREGWRKLERDMIFRSDDPCSGNNNFGQEGSSGGG